MKNKYNDKFNLLYSDTDSFVYEIETKDLYKDQYGNQKDLIDLGNVKIEKYNDTENDKRLGMMKSETGFDPIKEFISLAPKLYSFTTRNGNYNKAGYKFNKDEKFKKGNKKVGKGIAKSVLRDDIKHKDYNNILDTGNKKSCYQTNLRSKNHTIMTVRSEKKCLTAFCNKMYRIDKNTAYPFGHYKLNQTRDS